MFGIELGHPCLLDVGTSRLIHYSLFENNFIRWDRAQADDNLRLGQEGRQCQERQDTSRDGLAKVRKTMCGCHKKELEDCEASDRWLSKNRNQ